MYIIKICVYNIVYKYAWVCTYEVYTYTYYTKCVYVCLCVLYVNVQL